MAPGMSKPAPLTPQQLKVLQYMQTFFFFNDQLPTSKAIAEAFGYASANAANELVIKIAAAGWLEKNEVGRWRFAVRRMRTPAKVFTALLSASARAETFLSGFEDDDTQPEAGLLLGDLRTAIACAREVSE